VEQRIVIKFLVGENVPSAEIHHRLQQQYGEECLLPCTNILLIYIDPGKNCIDICYIRFFTYVITFMIVVLYGAVAQTKFPKPKFFAG